MKPRAAVVCALVACCGGPSSNPYPGFVQVSGESPFRSSCHAGSGEVAVGFEVEPELVVDPHDDLHLVGAWQQDRWSDGGADGLVVGVSFDGGASWALSSAALTACEGGSQGRASDPWVTITPDGEVYQASLVFDPDGATSQIAAARSTDGGVTWAAPVLVEDDDDFDIFNDKESITADPTLPDTVYLVWDRLTSMTTPTEPVGTGPAILAIGTGGVWGTPAVLFDPGSNAQTLGNVIAVVDGTVVDITDVITNETSNTPTVTATALRSLDHGITWSAPISIAAMAPHDLTDPKNGADIRSGGLLPEVAVDRLHGRLYVGWETTGSDAAGHECIVVTSSGDGGQTWSTPLQIDSPSSNAWDVTIAALGDGTVGAMYYDDRDDNPGDSDHYDVALFLATSSDGGATWTETRLTQPFDLGGAEIGGDELFLGDYEGLVGTGSAGFVPFFAAVRDDVPDDPGDIFVRPEQSGSSDGSSDDELSLFDRAFVPLRAGLLRTAQPARHRRASATSAR